MSEMRDDMDWLTANTVSWSLEVNPERLVYDTRADYLAFIEADDDPEPLTAAPNMWEARAYPATPVGYVMAFDVTAEGVVRKLRALADPRRPPGRPTPGTRTDRGELT